MGPTAMANLQESEGLSALKPSEDVASRRSHESPVFLDIQPAGRVARNDGSPMVRAQGHASASASFYGRDTRHRCLRPSHCLFGQRRRRKFLPANSPPSQRTIFTTDRRTARRLQKFSTHHLSLPHRAISQHKDANQRRVPGRCGELIRISFGDPGTYSNKFWRPSGEVAASNTEP